MYSVVIVARSILLFNSLTGQLFDYIGSVFRLVLERMFVYLYILIGGVIESSKLILVDDYK